MFILSLSSYSEGLACCNFEPPSVRFTADLDRHVNAPMRYGKAKKYRQNVLNAYFILINIRSLYPY